MVIPCFGNEMLTTVVIAWTKVKPWWISGLVLNYAPCIAAQYLHNIKLLILHILTGHSWFLACLFNKISERLRRDKNLHSERRSELHLWEVYYCLEMYWDSGKERKSQWPLLIEKPVICDLTVISQMAMSTQCLNFNWLCLVLCIHAQFSSILYQLKFL